MVDSIKFQDIDVEEVGATSAVLLGAAHHLGNTSFILLFFNIFCIRGKFYFL